ncbi:fibronectin type III domain-containing protein [Candidatus Nomurabacteria bacterium]|nr:fibronectin type III domain-containing protein [Candidatus Kaiserbacteria bacterium]MCB9810217.1 fibronectin type III domain-containing protein [Candidatus Nomurabacteria bacterium]MCB9818135.1 fibronectin type III domain-containing protein [Candidatus Nomurabacteria bacterium]
MKLRCTNSIAFLLLFTMLFSVPFSSLRAEDQVAPEISAVEISQVNDTSVTITWETDEDADSLVNYGLQPDYGIVRIPVADRTSHSITLDNLEPGRVYYFRVVSADEEGNQGISADYRVQTSGTPQADGSGTADGQGEGTKPQVGDGSNRDPQSQITTDSLTDSEATLRVIEMINEINNPEQLQEIVNETVKAIEGITEDLTIVGPPTVIPETNTATIKWTTDREASSEVRFSPTKSFNGGVYAFSQQSTGGNTTDHEIQVIGLDAFTDYSFKVLSTDTFGITGESRNYTFKTKATAPGIRNLRVVKVEENAATLAWDTNVPAKALVEYQDQTTGAQSSVGRPTLATTHQMRLADLTLGTRYVAFVTAENSGGDRVRSQPIQFITVRDIAPPIITNVTNESTLFPGSESRIQTIIEWDTDEPAYCLMTYQEGVAGGTDPYTIEKEQVQFTSKHVEVVVDFAPATVYQFHLECEDEAGNKVKSENFVLFTPIQEKNIIDLILENFEATFGWVKNIGG